IVDTPCSEHLLSFAKGPPSQGGRRLSVAVVLRRGGAGIDESVPAGLSVAVKLKTSKPTFRPGDCRRRAQQNSRLFCQGLTRFPFRSHDTRAKGTFGL